MSKKLIYLFLIILININCTHINAKVNPLKLFVVVGASSNFISMPILYSLILTHKKKSHINKANNEELYDLLFNFFSDDINSCLDLKKNRKNDEMLNFYKNIAINRLNHSKNFDISLLKIIGYSYSSIILFLYILSKTI